MSYGTGNYGQSGYGSPLDGGPSLISSVPNNLAVNVPASATLVLVVGSPADLDEFSLNVEINGLQAIVGGVFLSGYAGSIVYNPDTDVEITISTHPPFNGGANSVSFEILDLAGESGSASFTFDSIGDEVVVSETLTISEALFLDQDYNLAETVGISESLTTIQAHSVTVQETVSIIEDLQSGAFKVEALDGTTLLATFPEEVRYTGVGDLLNYTLRAVSLGVEVLLTNPIPGVTVLQSGSSARVLDLGRPDGLSDQFQLTGSVTLDNIGDYIEIQNGVNYGVYRIEAVLSANVVRLDRLLVVVEVLNGFLDGPVAIVNAGTSTVRLDHPRVTPSDPILMVREIENRTTGQRVVLPTVNLVDYRTFQVPSFGISAGDRVFAWVSSNAKITWKHTSAVKTLTFTVSPKFTIDKDYLFEVKNLRSKIPNFPVSLASQFRVLSSVVPRPRVVSAGFDPQDGSILVTFDQPMQMDDRNLGNLMDYVITGPSDVHVKRVFMSGTNAVSLETIGLGDGDYTLTISTSTPKDVAGNPLDPSFNTLIFTAAVPETNRSVFTDKGPIARPPLTLQSGTNGVIQTFSEVTLTGATLVPNLIGKMVRLSGSSINGGTFRISSIVSATRARLANASFTRPDPASITWEIFDPRDGEIADDPSDVVVRINGTPVVPEAVVGLLGQVLLATPPDPTDDVKIDYSWVKNPTVDVRRLNSKEFRLNSWNRDPSSVGSQHRYRFNNTLVRPGDYEPDNMLATQAQPELRELHYRAYERAYTPVLNDSSLLLLNSPTHRVAYPPSSRTLSEEFVNYEGIGLPEANIAAPWSRKGAGTASSSLGQLTVLDDSSGSFPTGQPIFWTRPVDLTFPHVFAISWRFTLNAPTLPDGVFTGVAAGYTTDRVAIVVGYVLEGGVRKIGILKRGFADNPSNIAAWTGGVDGALDPTGSPATFDWDTLHSYRIFRDINGTVRVFVDGDVIETLRVTEDELPYLEELAAPFDTLQGAFFGAISRPARSTSTWDFIRYLILPTNATQTAPSSFVSYEGNVQPESDAKPWTPVGSHGTATILGSDILLLDDTSATDAATASDVGLVGGDFRAYVRMEPLLKAASEFVLDSELQLRTGTFGPSPYGLALAVDDGERLMQLSFFPDRSTPKFSYGGRSLPEDFAPYNWVKVGSAPSFMQGRVLRIEDASVGDGVAYALDDFSPALSDDRVIGSGVDYMLEFRCRVVSYTADGTGFAGCFMQAFDSVRSVGLMLQEVAGTKYLSFHSDGVGLGASARFAFNWGDGLPHTYRLSKNTSGDLVSAFADGVFLGTFPYSSFIAPAPDPVGQVTFGSATVVSASSQSVVDWYYANAWRIRSDLQKYVGLWKGSDSDSLLGYHLPLKTSGRNATVSGNGLGDGNANFISDSIAAGDKLIVDSGSNRGVYEVAAVGSGQALTIVGSWTTQPSLVDYRIAKQTNWVTAQKYRITRDSTGEVAVTFGMDVQPSIRVGYNSIDLPASGVGVIRTLANGLPAVVFGSLDSENLSQSSWEFVRYGITKSVTELRAAPHHQVLNQWNVMHSPERLFSNIPHTLTSFKSSSTGIPPQTDPDFLKNPGLPAWTQLNQGTPLVPSTQNFQTRGPYPVQTYVSALNRPEDVLNSDGDFSLNDSSVRFDLVIPKDVLYSSLSIIEQSTGEKELLAPFDDESEPTIKGLQFQKNICLHYGADTLPENDTTASTPWTLASDDASQVTATAVAGVLTYATGGVGTKTIYRNDTPLPDAISLQSEAKFRVRLQQDSSGGTGDSQVRMGLSAPGLTVALAFVTSPLGERLILVLDLNSGAVLGSSSFDFLDGAYHTYRIVRDPGAGEVRVFIDA